MIWVKGYGWDEPEAKIIHSEQNKGILIKSSIYPCH